MRPFSPDNQARGGKSGPRLRKRISEKTYLDLENISSSHGPRLSGKDQGREFERDIARWNKTVRCGTARDRADQSGGVGNRPEGTLGRYAVCTLGGHPMQR